MNSYAAEHIVRDHIATMRREADGTRLARSGRPERATSEGVDDSAQLGFRSRVLAALKIGLRVARGRRPARQAAHQG